MKQLMKRWTAVLLGGQHVQNRYSDTIVRAKCKMHLSFSRIQQYAAECAGDGIRSEERPAGQQKTRNDNNQEKRPTDQGEGFDE